MLCAYLRCLITTRLTRLIVIAHTLAPRSTSSRAISDAQTAAAARPDQLDLGHVRAPGDATRHHSVSTHDQGAVLLTRALSPAGTVECCECVMVGVCQARAALEEHLDHRAVPSGASHVQNCVAQAVGQGGAETLQTRISILSAGGLG